MAMSLRVCPVSSPVLKGLLTGASYPHSELPTLWDARRVSLVPVDSCVTKAVNVSISQAALAGEPLLQNKKLRSVLLVHIFFSSSWLVPFR